MSDTKLLPCPFCGSGAQLIDRNEYDIEPQFLKFDVGCGTDGCYLESGAEYWTSKSDAIQMWNCRPYTAEQKEQLEIDSHVDRGI